MTARLLVLGGAGQVAQELAALARARGVALVAMTRAEADITDTAALAAAFERARPDVVVNAAAYTRVDKAESEPEMTWRINAEAPARLAGLCRAAGVPLIHLSTAYVFDGRKEGAYVEMDAARPLGVYGASKLAGEEAVRAALPEHVILRTNWVYGTHGANFLKTMLQLAATRDELRVVADQLGNPTASADLAEAVLAAAMTAAHGSAPSGASPWGVYHFAGNGVTSWHGFAQAIIDQQACFTGRRPPVTAIATPDYPAPARRPANSQLNSGRFAARFGVRARDWRRRTADAVGMLLGVETTAI